METVDCNKIDAKYFYVKKEGQPINQSFDRFLSCDRQRWLTVRSSVIRWHFNAETLDVKSETSGQMMLPLIALTPFYTHTIHKKKFRLQQM